MTLQSIINFFVDLQMREKIADVVNQYMEENSTDEITWEKVQEGYLKKYGQPLVKKVRTLLLYLKLLISVVLFSIFMKPFQLDIQASSSRTICVMSTS